MNILIPCSKLYLTENNYNPFVRVIYNGLMERGFNVTCDVDEFWNNSKSYDIIFFQWPEEVFFWSNYDIQKFSSLLEMLKKCKIRIFATCHNEHAHNNNSEANKLYEILYSQCDAMHHMGQYSYKTLGIKYPSCHHFIVQHPIFYDIVSLQLDRNKCRRKLGLPLNKIIILAFGAFRNDEEKKLFLSLRNLGKKKDVLLVAPSLSKGRLYNGRLIHKTFKNIYERIKYYRTGIICNKGRIDETLIPLYFTACDLVFIQRLEILNSGNLPLAFSAGKVVIGPNKGNVGKILSETGNPCFNPHNKEDVLKKAQIGLEASQNSNLGKENYIYAQKYMSQNVTMDSLAENILYFMASK